jgi:hypothetical protein
MAELFTVSRYYHKETIMRVEDYSFIFLWNKTAPKKYFILLKIFSTKEDIFNENTNMYVTK